MLTDDGKRKKLQPKTYADLGLKKAGTSNKAESRVINSPSLFETVLVLGLKIPNHRKTLSLRQTGMIVHPS